MPRYSVFNARVGDGSDKRPGGGCFPLGPTYPQRIARKLAALAESNPTPETYARERARILEGMKCQSA